MTGPISMFVPATLIAILALPLAFGLVPPNRIYGVRTLQTMASRENWYRVNRVGGFALLAASIAAICVYLAMPELASGRSFLGMLVLALPLLAALLSVGRYARSRSN